MGTKNNPGSYDCYANAKPDEPMFVLLGRDPSAYMLVALWATMRRELGEDEAKVAEAEACAKAMLEYAQKLGKDVDATAAAFGEVAKVYAKMSAQFEPETAKKLADAHASVDALARALGM